MAQDEQISLDKVVVMAKIPGPDLWQVTNGDKTLWILGTQTPLPKKMKWLSGPVEATIRESQAFLMPPTVTAEIGFFQKLSLIPAIVGIKKNPDKQTLKEVLPNEVYLQWQTLKAQYLGKDRAVEKTRPLFAGQKLYDKAISEAGLTEKNTVGKKVRRMAKKHQLTFIQPLIKLDIDNPKKSIKQFKKSSINDLECFTTTLQRVANDIPSMIVRAEAWASGNITQIKSLTYPDNNKACDDE